MRVTALLANHVEAVNNLLYTSGAGIDRAFVPAGASPPYGVQIGVGVLVEVPWTQTNQSHTLSLELVDADGHAVAVPTAPGVTEPVKADMQFNVGRPPTLEVGEEQTIALALGMPGLPFPALGQYRFVISIDQTPMNELRFKVVSQPGMTVMPQRPA